MADQKNQIETARTAEEAEVTPTKKKTAKTKGFDPYISLEKSIPQYFQPSINGGNRYQPSLMAQLSLHFFNQTRGIDVEEFMCLSVPLHDYDRDLNWDAAIDDQENESCLERLPSTAPSDIQYAPLPDFISSDKKLRQATRDLKDWAYHTHKLELYRIRLPKMESRPYEGLGDFRVRITDRLNDKKEDAIETLKERYAKKEKVLMGRMDRAEERLDKEKDDKKSSFMNAGITVLGALFGRSRASIGRAGSRIMKERGDISRAKERIDKIEEDIEDLENELANKIDELVEKYSLDTIEIEEFSIKLRKTDIDVERITLVWAEVV